MMLDQGGHENGVSMKYYVQRAPILAVMSKIVESIYVNVVNAGHDLKSLPEELGNLHHHYLDDRTLAGIIMGVQRETGDVVLRSDYFLSDLTFWLLSHFHGRLEIFVGRNLLFRKELGNESRNLKMMIRDECSADRSFCSRTEGSVEASVSRNDGVFTFLRGNNDRKFPQPSTRRDFYKYRDEQFSGTYPDRFGLYSGSKYQSTKILNAAESKAVDRVAKGIMKWILNITIEPFYDGSGICFATLLESNKNDRTDKIRIGDLLHRHPGIFNLQTGLEDIPEPVLVPPEPAQSEPDADDYMSVESSYSDEGDPMIDSVFAEKILMWFPAVKDVLRIAQDRCFCYHCTHGSKLSQCKPGCLREGARRRLLVLLAHAIAEAMGASDVSGRCDSEDTLLGTIDVLAEIIQHKRISWDTWFRLSACVTTGLDWGTFYNVDAEGLSSYAGVQYGSLVVHAAWIDLSRTVELRGSFRIVVEEGCVADVPDTIGYLRCEKDERNHSVSHLPDVLSPAEQLPTDTGLSTSHDDLPDICREADTLKVNTSRTAFRSDNFLYRLLTIVEAGQVLRIVDPSEIVTGLAHSRPGQCKHDPNSPVRGDVNVVTDDFDRILKDWLASEAALSSTIYMTKTFEDPEKINTVLSLVQKGAVIRNPSKLCLNCAIKLAQENELHYIVNWLPSRQHARKRLRA
ncbi:hypothetical protein SLS54_009103 [Diplodia seriata]